MTSNSSPTVVVILLLSILVQISHATVSTIFGFDQVGVTYRSINVANGQSETIFTIPELDQRIYQEMPYISDVLAIGVGWVDYVNKTTVIDFIDIKNQKLDTSIVYYNYSQVQGLYFDYVIMDPTNQNFIVFDIYHYGSIVTLDIDTLNVIPGTPNITLPQVAAVCYPTCYATEAQYIFDYPNNIVYVHAMYTFYQEDDQEEESERYDDENQVIDQSELNLPLPCGQGGCQYMLTLSINNGSVLGAVRLGFYYTMKFIKVESPTSIITLYLAPTPEVASTQIISYNPTNGKHSVMVSPKHLPYGASDPVDAASLDDEIYFIYQVPLPPKGQVYGQMLGIYNITSQDFLYRQTNPNTTFIYVPPN
ncbi:hypothetical protein DFA_04745 [Cavenderia fasciculata]|uniref:Uncharacterized protein n=1 Tax=Cavenderia fasciculata TaxID=261658 RepID=F4PQF2_CACFS|nr:uncharacterized protein DFA_04745 [Cavenderia fasciculata]EGG22615.1 hypothetical protein DFA_04745 [Cavenderia fasciculata]|eukprot:XP_004360466.1 hypothetical protein DFA_04745 [Cavenderia fasciculata]